MSAMGFMNSWILALKFTPDKTNMPVMNSWRRLFCQELPVVVSGKAWFCLISLLPDRNLKFR